MRRVTLAFGVLCGVGLVLTGCTLLPGQQRDAWRGQVERACLARGDVTPSSYASRLSPINGPGQCGIGRPFRVTALSGGTVQLSNPATLGCPVIAETERWLEQIVQPAAALYFGSRVVAMRSGDYACRTRNSRRGAPLSEHAFGNAVDVMAFTLADGRDVTVLRGWRGEEDERAFLREVFVGACRGFTTVLGPGADAFHYDHFHFDLARHDARGERRVCRPDISFTPRIDPDAPAPPEPRAPVFKRPAPGLAPAAPQAAIDILPAEPALSPGIRGGFGPIY